VVRMYPFIDNGPVNKQDGVFRGAILKTVDAKSNRELRAQLWSVNQRVTEAEESPLLRFVTRKLVVKTRQRNCHCGEMLQSKDY
jgi:hypothetical protein